MSVNTTTTIQSPQWTTGDFTFISTDNVSFKVQASELLAKSSSAVLHYANSWGTKMITLTDSDIESSKTVAMFLAYIKTGVILPSSAATDMDFEAALPEYAALLRFLKKWKCYTGVGVLMAAFYEEAPKPLRPILAFVLGAVADEPLHCAMALGLAASSRAYKPVQYMSAASWKLLSFQYSRALVSCNLIEGSPEVSDFLKRMEDLPVRSWTQRNAVMASVHWTTFRTRFLEPQFRPTEDQAPR